MHSILRCKNPHIKNWFTSFWEENWFQFIGWWIFYNLLYSLKKSQIHQTVFNFRLWVIAISGEYPIISKCETDEIQRYHTPCGIYMVNTSFYKRKSYQQTDFEYIWSIFYQVRLEFSHLKVCLPEKPPTPNNIGKYL